MQSNISCEVSDGWKMSCIFWSPVHTFVALMCIYQLLNMLIGPDSLIRRLGLRNLGLRIRGIRTLK